MTGVLIGMLVIAGFAVGFLLPTIRDRIRAGRPALSAQQQAQIRALVSQPCRSDGTVMSADELAQKIIELIST